MGDSFKTELFSCYYVPRELTGGITTPKPPVSFSNIGLQTGDMTPTVLLILSYTFRGMKYPTDVITFLVLKIPVYPKL